MLSMLEFHGCDKVAPAQSQAHHNSRLFRATCTSHGLALNFRVRVCSLARESLAPDPRLSLLCHLWRGGRSRVFVLERRLSALLQIGTPTCSKFTTVLVPLLFHLTLVSFGSVSERYLRQ